MERPHVSVLVFLMAFLVMITAGCSQSLSNTKSASLLSVQDQKDDLELLWSALSEAHSGLDRYEDRVTIENRVETMLHETTKPLSQLDFLAKIAAFNATLNSGHLYTIANGPLEEAVLSLPRIPLDVRVVQGRLYVWRDLSEAALIPRGSEILSINGRAAQDILDLIIPHVPTDGVIETRKAHLINRVRRPSYQGFDFYYALYVERPSAFALLYRDPSNNAEVNVTLEGISFQEKRRRRTDQGGHSDLPAPYIRLLEDRNAALLSIPRSFSRDGDPDFEQLLRELVDRIKESDIENLIIDVRGNNGGNDDHPSQIFRHLTNQPFRYYRGLFKTSIDLRAFAPFVHEPRSEDWFTPKPEWYARDEEGRYWEIPEGGGYHLLHTLEPEPNPFLGSVYVLADGGSFSSGAQVVALLHDNQRALLIGEETSGDYAGPDGGSTLPIILPNSNIHVRIPLLRSLNAFQTWPAGRGALPDCYIAPSIDDMLSERDVHLELAFELMSLGIDRESFNKVATPNDLPAACR